MDKAFFNKSSNRVWHRFWILVSAFIRKEILEKEMKKLSLKGWIRKNWDLCREIVRLRNNNGCELCGSIFELQVDHAFSRTKRQLFYEISNLTLLCSSCHTAKSFNQGDKVLEVFEHVEKREGVKFFKNREIAKKNGPFGDWNKIWYQEQENIRLNEIKTELLSR